MFFSRGLLALRPVLRPPTVIGILAHRCPLHARRASYTAITQYTTTYQRINDDHDGVLLETESLPIPFLLCDQVLLLLLLLLLFCTEKIPLTISGRLYGGAASFLSGQL